jgi:peptide chain release factor subunit 1
MQLNDVTPERLRSLSEVRLDEGHVLSVVLDLDPSDFAVATARASAIRSILDEARARIAEPEGLTHDEQVWLRADLGRVEQVLTEELDPQGAHAVAVFCSTPADLLEVLRLPQPVPSTVVVDRAPHLEPLARQAPTDRWAVLVASRSITRIFTGTSDRLVETSTVDADVKGQHKKGGWSQPRYERSIDDEAGAAIGAAAERLAEQGRRRPFDHVFVAANDEVWPILEGAMETQLRERVASRVATDLQHASAEEILAAARPAMEAVEREREAELLGRLQEGLAKDSFGVIGTEAIDDMLEQRRVEALLVGERFDDSAFLQRAMEAAVQQDAAIVFVRHHDTLDDVGGIAAVLRF